MEKNPPVLKAEEIKSDETRAARGSGGGVEPGHLHRPIRRRGYYRALKRGEAWALVRKTMNEMHDQFLRNLLSPLGALPEFYPEDGAIVRTGLPDVSWLSLGNPPPPDCIGPIPDPSPRSSPLTFRGIPIRKDPS